MEVVALPINIGSRVCQNDQSQGHIKCKTNEYEHFGALEDKGLAPTADISPPLSPTCCDHRKMRLVSAPN